jgi:sugar O-acyltransferase (sialic acid O-acetyltransferase NeuD family)
MRGRIFCHWGGREVPFRPCTQRHFGLDLKVAIETSLSQPSYPPEYNFTKRTGKAIRILIISTHECSERRMEQWVIFGFGNYISDIFDIIHDNDGKIKAVINNFNPTEKQLANIERRLSFLPYEVPIVPLNEFRPSGDERYLYGFHTGRENVVTQLEEAYEIRFSSLVHPSAHLGSNVHLGRGVCIGPHTVLAPNVTVGNFSSINRACSIGHDTKLGEFSTINPGALIAGMVTVGDRTLIGIGAVIIDGIQIGKHSVVGAGAVVVKDVPDDVVVVGVPAKVLKKNE